MWCQSGRFCRAVWEAVDGLKTLGAALVFVGLGLADYFDVVNVRPVLDQLLGEDKAAKLMVIMPVVFGTLRFMTSGKVRWFRDRREQPFDELNQREPH